jgi:hypothetical protein
LQPKCFSQSKQTFWRQNAEMYRRTQGKERASRISAAVRLDSQFKWLVAHGGCKSQGTTRDRNFKKIGAQGDFAYWPRNMQRAWYRTAPVAYKKTRGPYQKHAHWPAHMAQLLWTILEPLTT